jgi:hypothetical protein
MVPSTLTISTGLGSSYQGNSPGDTLTIKIVGSQISFTDQLATITLHNSTTALFAGGGTHTVSGPVAALGYTGIFVFSTQSTDLVIDDSGESTVRNMALTAVNSSFGEISGLPSGPVDFPYQDVGDVQVITSKTDPSKQDTVNVQATGPNGLTTITGSGTEVVKVVGNANGLAGIQGPLFINNTQAHTTLTVDDSADENMVNLTLDSLPNGFDGELSSPNTADIEYQYASTQSVTLLTGNASGDIVNVGGTGGAGSTTILTGTGFGDIVNVYGTGGAGSTTISGAAPEKVNVVGVADGLNAIGAPLFIKNTEDYTTLTVDDSADTWARVAVLNTAPAPNNAYGSINGLGGAAINYKYKDTNGVTLDTGNNAKDVVNVQADGPYGVTLVGHAAEAVNVGHAGKIGGVAGGLTVENAGGLSTLTVDDSNDPTKVNLTFSTPPSGSPMHDQIGLLSSLYTGIVTYYYAQTGNVTLLTGPVSGDIVNVQATGGAGPTTIIGKASEAVGVGNSDHTLADIGAPLKIENSNYSSIGADDSGDGKMRIANLGTGAAGFGQLTGLGGAAINFQYAGTSNFTLATGAAVNDVVNVQATGGSGVTRIEGSAPETVNVSNAGSLAYIGAPITVVNTPAFTTLKVDDSHDPGSRIVNLSTFGTPLFKQSGSITGLAGLGGTAINYVLADTAAVFITTGTGNDVVNVMNTTGVPCGVPVNLANGGGLTTVDTVVFSNGAGLSGGRIDGGVGVDWLDYAAYTTPVTVNLSTNTATGVGGGVYNILGVRGGHGGNNNLTGGAQGNILVGDGNNNMITGVGVRNVLIGGPGHAVIHGGPAGDLIVGGHTTYDTPVLNPAALDAIFAEWQSADSYWTRVAKITAGVPPMAAKFVLGTTVFDVVPSDNINPGNGMYWKI